MMKRKDKRKLSYIDKIYLVYGVFGRDDKIFVKYAVRAAEHGVEHLAELSGAQEMLETLENELYKLKVLIDKDIDGRWIARLDDDIVHGDSYAMVVYNAAIKFYL